MTFKIDQTTHNHQGDDASSEPPKTSSWMRVLAAIKKSARQIPIVGPLLVKIPKKWRPVIYIVTPVILIIQMVGLNVIKELGHTIYYYFNGPRMTITAIPQNGTDLSSFGSPNVLTEFDFDRTKIKKYLTLIQKEDDFNTLIKMTKTIPIYKFRCDGPGKISDKSKEELFLLSIIVQNSCDSTASDYDLYITFNTLENHYKDPGIRIAKVEVDDLKVDYLYTQEKIDLPSCVDQQANVAALSLKHQSTQEEEKKTKEPSLLVRKSYQNIGLTRDLLILHGTLDPQLFQTINLLLKMPPHLDKFALIYRFNCTNCVIFNKSGTYGQVINVQR